MDARQRAVVWTEAAQRALDEVIAYIAQDSASGALHVLDAALSAASSLATLAARGRVVPEIDDESIRELFVFRYRLLYRLEPDRVVIVAFLHGARDFAFWQTEQDPY